MYLKHLNIYFFFILLFLVSAIVFQVFQPFLLAIVLAAVFAALFQKQHQFFLRLFRGRSALASSATCFFIIILLATPIVLSLSLVANEANQLYHSLGEGQSAEGVINTMIENVRKWPYAEQAIGNHLNTQEIFGYLQAIGQSLVGFLASASSAIGAFFFLTFLLFFSLYYFLIDGVHALEFIKRLSPLRDEHEQLLITKFVSMSRAVIKGTFVIGFIQALIGFVTFLIAGVPSAMILTVTMFLFSVIPMIGAAPVWLPVGIILLLVGHTWQGILVLVVGSLVISVIDNLLRPKLVGQDTQLHPLLVFFSILGGMQFFGLPGFVLGPILTSLFMALWEIYGLEFKKQLTSYNEAILTEEIHEEHEQHA